MIEGLQAKLVWDGAEVRVPEEMGTPKENQLTGTVGEQLCELSCRVCYDSLGSKRSRSTEENMAHLLEVKHYSVFEHFQRTYLLTFGYGVTDWCAVFQAFANRKGIFIRRIGENDLRVTINIRAVLEWNKYTEILAYAAGSTADAYRDFCRHLGWILQDAMSQETPLVVPSVSDPALGQAMDRIHVTGVGLVDPESAHEKIISIFLQGSRGFSHEQVRHRFAMSQRSTRYVNEAKSLWVWHPLLHKFFADTKGLKREDREFLEFECRATQSRCQQTYKQIVRNLQPWLKADLDARDPDNEYNAFTARKQARGAARGFLGNALGTEMIFTASAFDWIHMLGMRAADAADAEIRIAYATDVCVLEALKSCRYHEEFQTLEVVPASDGLGYCLAGGGHK